ncbi:MAG: O-antigen ligase family protein [Acidimicrobiales bacterium]
MALALAPDVASYRFDRNRLEKPGFFERAMVVVTTGTLLMGLPVDWFLTRAQVDLRDGNLKMVAVQLTLMMFGVLRIVGRLDNVVQVIKLEVTIFLFTGLAMASLFWSADIGETIRQSIVIAAIAFYGLYLIIRFELVEIIRLLAAMFTVSAIASLTFIIAFPVYGITAGSGNWDGVFYHKNALGFGAAMAIPALVVAARTTPRYRFVFYAAAVAHLVMLFFSESKTMYVAGFGSLLLLMVYRLFRGRKTLRGAVMTSMFGSTVFATAFATANIALLAKWLDKDVSLTGRVPLWEDLIPVAMQRIPFGFGYRAAFGGYFSPVHEVWIQHGWQPSHAHNALFHIWLELGLVGVALFMVGFFRAVKRAIHVVNIIPDAVGLWPLTFLSTSLLISVSESGITYTESGWLMYVVAVLAVSNWTKNKIVLVDPDKLEKMKRSQEIEEGLGADDVSLTDFDLVGANVR